MNSSLAPIFRNTRILISGNAISSFFGILYLAILTRALSLDQFGIYAIYGTFVNIVGRFTCLQTWQAQIHYALHADISKTPKKIANIFFFGWVIDILGGLLGFGVALALGLVAPHIFGLSGGSLSNVAVLASLLLFNWTNVPTAYFRIKDRFFPQALYQTLSSFFQLCAVFILWLIGEERLIFYLATTAANDIIGKTCFFIHAFVDGMKEGIVEKNHISLTDLKNDCPGIGKFIITSNLTGIIRGTRDFDIILVNIVLGAQLAGVFKIAKTLIAALGKLTGPFYQSMYPEINRLVAKSATSNLQYLLKRLSKVLALITGSVWLGFVLIGPYVLEIVFGREYISAYSVSAWSLAAITIWSAAQPLSNALVAMRRNGRLLIIQLIVVPVYLFLLTVLVPKIGLTGAGVSLVLAHLLWSGAVLWALVIQIRSIQ